MSLAIPTLKINGESAMSVRNGSYTVYNLEPGEHTFILKRNGNWAVSNIEFVANVKKNERQFYRLSTDAGGIFVIGSAATVKINGYFGKVTEEFAKTEMQNLLYTGNWP